MTRRGSSPVAERDLGPGDVCAGRYAIERILGEGGCGVVYVARVVASPADEAGAEAPGLEAGREVALKLLHRHLIADPQVPRRFLREARILQSLSGDHLASVLDVGEVEDGRLYMAMELAPGISLDELVGQTPLAPERAIRLVSQLCAALEVAHAAGVVHRDLKPLNVMVEPREGGEHVRVLDFGMAKIVRGELGCSVNALTQQNMVFGTPEYMAPEQARGDDVDERCDVYATGVILYQLLTGTLPFQAATPIATMTAHLAEEPEPPTRRAPRATIAPALEAVVLHALAKRPELRYPSALALRLALESASERPLDVTSIIPPSSRDELERRDTDPFVHMTTSLRRTEVSLPGVESFPSPSAAPPLVTRQLLAWALLAAALGVLLGVIMSFAGRAR